MAGEQPGSSAIPTTQKTWRITRGSPDPATALSFTDSPIPSLGKGEILVKVQAAALNPVGFKVLSMFPGFLLRRIQAHELDFAGIVVDANGSSEFKVGDSVVGVNPFPRVLWTGWGALAQYTRTQTATTVLRPHHLTPTQACGLPLAGLTAYQAVVEIGKLQAGQSIFVNGGSTTVGAYAIQLAKAIGAKVSVSASGKNEKYVRGLGADEFFDYKKAPLHEQLLAADPRPKYDVFFEAVGQKDYALFTQSPAFLAPQSVFIVVDLTVPWSAVLLPTWLGGPPRPNWSLVGVSPDQARMTAFMKYVEEGKAKPLVDSVYAFEDALKAYERIMTNRATGKVVVKVDADAE